MDTRSCPFCQCFWCAMFALGVCPYCDLGLEDETDEGDC